PGGGGVSRLRLFRRVLLIGLRGREAVREGDRERVQCWLPSGGPSCPAAPGRVQRSGDQVEALECGLLGREGAAGLDRSAVAGVERLDRVRAAQHPADLQVVVQERDELVPGMVPKLDDRRVTATPGLV